MQLDIVILPHTFGMKNPSDFIFVPLMVDSLLRSNKNSKVTFLNPNKFSLDIAAIEEFPYDDSQIDGVAELSRSYVHLSTNARDFELFCIKRFFILRQYMIESELKSCLVVETDLLFFDSFSLLPFVSLQSPNVFLSDRKCISTALVSLEFLNSFCEGVLNIYKNKDLLAKLTNWYEGYNKSGGRGGICDMTFCDYIRNGQYEFECREIEDFSQISLLDGSCLLFDSFIGRKSHTGYSGNFLMEHSPFDQKEIKKITFERGLANAYLDNSNMIRMGSLHFQGSAKLLMGSYYTRWLKSFS